MARYRVITVEYTDADTEQEALDRASQGLADLETFTAEAVDNDEPEHPPRVT